jgi:hypothetical protein
MMIRRMETAPAPEPPVRFYKTIALCFLFLTVIVLGVVVFITSKKATIVIVSKEDTQTVPLTVSVASSASGTAAIPGMVSSTSFAWSNTYYPTGTKVVEGSATGKVTIYNKSSSAQTLIKTTRLLTNSGVLFRLSDTVNVPASGQVDVAVYADKAGEGSDIAAAQFTIPGLSEDKQKVIYAVSTAPMVGGAKKVGVLSDDDITGALADYKAKVQDAYLATVKDTSMSHVVMVLNQNVAANHKAGDEVADFTISGTNTILLVNYNPADLARLVSDSLSNKFDSSSEKLLSLTKDPKVTISSYDVAKGMAELAVTQDVVVTLDSNGEKLLSKNFLGKKKEDIQRYVLGLDHVSGVDVQFSPGWMLSAPTVPDRIKVVVKNMN